MRWNSPDKWVWSAEQVHEPLVDAETFERAQHVLAAHGKDRTTRESHRRAPPLRAARLADLRLLPPAHAGQLEPGTRALPLPLPGRVRAGQHHRAPRNVYLAERDVLPALDEWLAQAFTPDHLDETIQALAAAQPDTDADPDQAAAEAIIADCDAKLARHRHALEAGAAPALVAAWTAEVQARQPAALASRRPRSQRMSDDEIRTLVQALGDIAAVLRAAGPADKAEVYRQLGLQLAYQPEQRLVRAEASPENPKYGLAYGSCPRGDLPTSDTHN